MQHQVGQFLRGVSAAFERVYRQGAAGGGQHIGVLRMENIFFLEVQVVFESLPERGDKGQRSSAEQDFGLDFMPSRQRGHHLDGNRMENGSADIGPAHVLGH